MTESSMIEAIVHQDTSVKLQRTSIPCPGPNEVLIRVVVAGSNPKDYKRPIWQNKAQNPGDDIAGTIASCGDAVLHLFRPGQRVAALHSLGEPHGAYAEFSVAPADCTFALPDGVSFEEAATIPLAAMTAAVGLFLRLGLPGPWMRPGNERRGEGGGRREGEDEFAAGPLLIYGAAGAVGAFAVQLAKRAGIGPIITVAGKGIPFVQGLLDEGAGDAVVDYRQGNEAVVTGLKQALGGRRLAYAFDCVSEAEKGSWTNIVQVLDSEPAKLVLVLPATLQAETEQAGGRHADIPDHVQTSESMVLEVPHQFTDFGACMSSLFEKGLREGWFKPHPHQVIPGGLQGVHQGLLNLKEGKASATKYVFRISETPELSP